MRLSDGQLKFWRKSLLYSIKSQLHFLHGHKRMKIFATDEVRGYSLRTSVEELMDMLDLKKYYPQKLKFEDMIKLTGDVLDNSARKPEPT